MSWRGMKVRLWIMRGECRRLAATSPSLSGSKDLVNRRAKHIVHCYNPGELLSICSSSLDLTRYLERYV